MSTYFTFDKTVKLIITIAIIAGVIWLIGVLKNVLLPFCLACLLSYILEPVVEYNQKIMALKKRAPAVLLTLGDGIIICALLVYFFMPIVMHEIFQMGNMIKTYGTHEISLPFLPEPLSSYIEGKVDFDSLVARFEEGKFGSWIDQGANVISVSVEYLIHTLEWLVTFIYVIFILLDYDRFSKGFALLIPKKFRPAVTQVMNDVKYYMNKYFRSQLFIASCAAVLYCIGFTIVGLPMSIVMGILVGILYMIPYFQYITLIPVIVICFITSLDGQFPFWVKLGECGLVYLVSQCFCDYILTPKIMGKSLGLNPAIILLSLSVWGTLLGIIGMIIALPLTTILLVYYKKVIIEHIPLSAPTDIISIDEAEE
ncbi:MAG: AI-2E family transporter [Muribaculaceae bacterium]|nr:AI-2E family transporter [Muribaculaceae bacterium]